MIGVILAGGRSSRMGEDKALVHIAGTTMLDRVAAAIAPVADEVCVAGRDSAPHGVTAVPDTGAPHRGPLAGIVAVAASHPDDTLLVVAVDQPWVRTETLQHLVSLTEDLPVVPVDEGVRQTGCATYPAAALHSAREELDAGGSIQSLLDRTAFTPVVESEWRTWGEDGRSWFSVNTATDIDRGIERFGTP